MGQEGQLTMADQQEIMHNNKNNKNECHSNIIVDKLQGCMSGMSWLELLKLNGLSDLIFFIKMWT